MSVFASAWMNAGPNGIPRLIFGYRAATLYQNSSCTRTGVPRKNQMYSQLPPDTSGLGDRRMTATISTIAAATQRPGCRTGTALIWSGRPVGAGVSVGFAAEDTAAAAQLLA